MTAYPHELFNDCFSQKLGYNPITKNGTYTVQDMQEFGICAFHKQNSFVCPSDSLGDSIFCAFHTKKIRNKTKKTKKQEQQQEKEEDKSEQVIAQDQNVLCDVDATESSESSNSQRVDPSGAYPHIDCIF